MSLSARVLQSFHHGDFLSKVWNRARWELSYRLFHLPELTFIGARDLNGIIKDDICLPPFYEHHRHNDVTPLFALLKALQPRLVIELGTAHGNLTANICRLTTAKVITVNALAEQMTGHWVTFALDRDEIGRVYRQYGFESRVVQICENTLTVDLEKHVTPASAELGIIDACHDSDYVINDFLKVASLIRSGGIVMLHDTHPEINREQDGSYRACMSLRGKGWNIQHIQGTWWGIWVRDGLAQSRVRELFSQSH